MPRAGTRTRSCDATNSPTAGSNVNPKSPSPTVSMRMVELEYMQYPAHSRFRPGLHAFATQSWSTSESSASADQSGTHSDLLL